MSSRDRILGPNEAYLIELYERYQADPASVDEATRKYFEQWGPPAGVTAISPAEGTSVDVQKAMAVANLAHSIRSYGHLQAKLDPLGSPLPGDPSLDHETHDLTENDLHQMPASLVGGPASLNQPDAWGAIQSLRQIYSSTTGYDLSHIRAPEERDWLRQAVESRRFCPPNDSINMEHLLERLTEVEVFEHFLHRTFPGKTRFSIEGVDMLVPVIDEIVGAAAEADVCMVFLGMAHRGRLNVLAHVLGKPYAQILAEFKDPKASFYTNNDMGWMGDVKYHKGLLRAVEEDKVIQLLIYMPPNPSHLEHINPVLEGMARAADTQMDRPGVPRFFPKASIPILVHGDASFPGQGIVAETFNLSQLSGYHTAGTIHIITNNQLGYTATIREARSTLYAGDLAKGFKVPVVYVNADDPEACIEVARMAFAYRQRFHKDFLIDLVGYRRYGHNEGDEPGFTQPVMYQSIRSLPTVRERWANKLEEDGHIQEGRAAELVREKMAHLQQIYEQLKPEEHLDEPIPETPPEGAARDVKTGVPLDRLRALNDALMKMPEDFTVNRKLVRNMERRRQIFEENTGSQELESGINWATAEELAFASILEEGIPIRLTGEDVVRGTFSQRHAAFFDFENERKHIPLQRLPQAKAAFEIHNTPVTENATLGFEFGFNVQAPDRLVVWEAQYGDFINVAQAIIDEFIVSARVKWGQTPSLVLLLPHGNEGQGPDHSSARVERFLQLAENNLRIAYPTTAAQYFHLLRRQALLLNTDPLPLIVLTPKGLLRHPLVISRPSELADGSWLPVLDDPQSENNRKHIKCLLLCTGRVYVDLVESPLRAEHPDTAIARLEQLYPFPAGELEALFDGYSSLEQVLWVQEEPRNMGAWDFLRPRLAEVIGARWPLRYVGRSPSSSPAEGSAAWYSANQRALIEQAFRTGEKVDEPGLLVELM